jgi:FkbM family methyltransferase
MTSAYTNALEELLAELLVEPGEQMAARAAQKFDRLAAPFENRIVIFGAGYLGKLALSGLRTAGIEPLALCDNNSRLWETEIEGLPVLSPVQAAERHRNDAAFVVSIYNSSSAKQQLRELGCPRVVPYPVLFWKYWQCMPKEDRLELPHRMMEWADDMPPAYDLLSDDISRQEFRAQVRWRCLMDYSCLPAPHAAADMYFPPELFRVSPDEVLVDCGAFDGDSIRSFIDKAGDRFRRIFAFEADAANVSSLRRYCAGLSADVAGKITIMPYAVARQDGTVRFCAEGSVGSKVVETGAAQVVECRSLDSALSHVECPTLIKMDIEGAELEAIMGAGKTIAHCRPIMAVCAYHKCDHLWKIPQLLRSANPDYRIFLRRYAEDCWETVYYAVPPERLRLDNKPEGQKSS